jgi:hypothetical protein
MMSLKFLLIIVFTTIFVQDSKDRQVYWFLFPIMGSIAFYLQIENVPFYSVFINTGFNLLFILVQLFVIYLYGSIKLKKSVLSEVFGLGDMLFFIFIAFSFSIISFFILFLFSLIFSLVLHFVLRSRQTKKSVPLAGYMALFFGVVYVISFFWDSNILYAY